MQEKIVDIEHIQYSLWGMYKKFLVDRNLGECVDNMSALLNGCKDPLKHFCHNLIIAWINVVDGLTEDFKNGRDVGKKTDCIKHIQNTVWAMYKDFLVDHGMAVYNHKMGELSREYYDKGNKQMLLFCQNVLISWIPIINGFAEEFRSGE